jgi:hypothetical protein
MKTKMPTEFQEQCALIEWANLIQVHKYLSEYEGLVPGVIGDYLVASANGGKRPKWVDKNGKIYSPEGKKLKKSGVKDGFPDLFLYIPVDGYNGLAIEMKRIKHSAVSKEQVMWLQRLKDRGFYAYIAHGFEDAKNVIEAYLMGALSVVIGK